MKHGEFLDIKTGLRIPNTIMDEGAEQLLKMAMQNGGIGGTGSFYIGLMQDIFSGENMTLLDIVGEPTSQGGYARQAVARDAIDWNNPITQNNITSIETKVVTFAAIGADFSNAISRLFLTNVLSGTAGILFSISAALTAPLLIADGNSAQYTYKVYFL